MDAYLPNSIWLIACNVRRHLILSEALIQDPIRTPKWSPIAHYQWANSHPRSVRLLAAIMSCEISLSVGVFSGHRVVGIDAATY